MQGKILKPMKFLRPKTKLLSIICILFYYDSMPYHYFILFYSILLLAVVMQAMQLFHSLAGKGARAASGVERLKCQHIHVNGDKC